METLQQSPSSGTIGHNYDTCTNLAAGCSATRRSWGDRWRPLKSPRRRGPSCLPTGGDIRSLSRLSLCRDHILVGRLDFLVIRLGSDAAAVAGGSRRPFDARQSRFRIWFRRSLGAIMLFTSPTTALPRRGWLRKACAPACQPRRTLWPSFFSPVPKPISKHQPASRRTCKV